MRTPNPEKAVRLAEAERWRADVEKLTWLDFEALVPHFNDMQVKELRRVVYRISVERGLGKKRAGQRPLRAQAST